MFSNCILFQRTCKGSHRSQFLIHGAAAERDWTNPWERDVWHLNNIARLTQRHASHVQGNRGSARGNCPSTLPVRRENNPENGCETRPSSWSHISSMDRADQLVKIKKDAFFAFLPICTHDGSSGKAHTYTHTYTQTRTHTHTHKHAHTVWASYGYSPSSLSVLISFPIYVKKAQDLKPQDPQFSISLAQSNSSVGSCFELMC